MRQEWINLQETSHSEDYFALGWDENSKWTVFRKHTGELVGFANLGEANEDLEILIGTHDSSTSKTLPEVVVFMVRHISKPSMSFPVAMYSSASVSGAKLYPVVFEVVEALELHGFSVVSISSDGNSPNCKFVALIVLHLHAGHLTIMPCPKPRHLLFLWPSTLIKDEQGTILQIQTLKDCG